MEGARGRRTAAMAVLALAGPLQYLHHHPYPEFAPSEEPVVCLALSALAASTAVQQLAAGGARAGWLSIGHRYLWQPRRRARRVDWTPAGGGDCGGPGEPGIESCIGESGNGT